MWGLDKITHFYDFNLLYYSGREIIPNMMTEDGSGILILSEHKSFFKNRKNWF